MEIDKEKNRNRLSKETWYMYKLNFELRENFCVELIKWSRRGKESLTLENRVLKKVICTVQSSSLKSMTRIRTSLESTVKLGHVVCQSSYSVSVLTGPSSRPLLVQF